jgi:hypothetical protein
VAYRYERGEHRNKHCWKNDHAGFVVWQGRHTVGKCPRTITNELAESILNQSVAEPDPFALPGEATDRLPRRLYAVYEGVIYEAVPTQPGSYHGYPWQARPGRTPLPPEVIGKLRQMAENQGCLEGFEDWLDQYG